MLLTTRCPVCRRPEGAPCPECVELLEPAPPLAPPPGMAGLHAALVFDGAGRLLVSRLKYRDARATVGWLADAMVGRVPDAASAALVTWAPTTARRRRERGFDQSELLARAVARRLGVPVVRLLRRGDGSHQTGRSARERRHGVRFCARRGLEGSEVVVVDDVVTTGSTMAAAARALTVAGARSVRGLAAGATPPPSV